MWNPPLRRIPWRKDAMTWWMHVMCLEINLWGSDFPAVQKTTPILVLKLKMQLRGQNIHSLWTNASFPGKRLAQLLVKAFFLYLYLRNVVLHLVLSWRRFFFHTGCNVIGLRFLKHLRLEKTMVNSSSNPLFASWSWMWSLRWTSSTSSWMPKWPKQCKKSRCFFLSNLKTSLSLSCSSFYWRF